MYQVNEIGGKRKVYQGEMVWPESKIQVFAAFWLHCVCHNTDSVKSSNGEDQKQPGFNDLCNSEERTSGTALGWGLWDVGIPKNKTEVGL